MSGSETGRDVVHRFWHGFAERDFDAAVACLSPRFTQRWPQSGERIVGPNNWLSMATHHPTLPDAELVDLYGCDPFWIAELVFDYHDGTPPYQVAPIHRVESGSIVETVEYFGVPFPAAEWRAAWVERA